MVNNEDAPLDNLVIEELKLKANAKSYGKPTRVLTISNSAEYKDWDDYRNLTIQLDLQDAIIFKNVGGTLVHNSQNHTKHPNTEVQDAINKAVRNDDGSVTVTLKDFKFKID